jgi:flavin reductase (DIM6/NTAB) family NADH-FMN oxidoreductase RutF
MKKEVDLRRAKWIIEPGCVVLVTSGDMDNANVMTFSWQTPVTDSDGCFVLLPIGHARHTYDLIKQNPELVINVPGESLLEQVHFAGTVTGRNVDKFKESGLTPVPAGLVKPPLIGECAAHLECRVVDTYEMQTHDVLICQVIRATADADLFDGKWIPEKFHTLHYLAGKTYGVIDRQVEAQGKR